MDARSKFHLARARAHLERGNADRALRHLHKCGFGVGESKFVDADAAADAYEKMTDEERERGKKVVEWRVFSDALDAAYKARDVNALFRVLVEQRADAGMLADLPYGVTSVAGLIRSLATYDTANDAARAYEKLERRGKLAEMRSTKMLDLATLRSAVIEATKSADHNKLFHLVVQEGTSNIADAMHGIQKIPRLIRGAVHKSADDAADAYEKMTDEERAARKATRLEATELHRAVEAAYAAYDYNALFHLAVRQGGFDVQDLGVKFETFGAGTKSVVDLIRSRARYDSAEEAAAAFMKLTLPQREARKAATSLKLDVFERELVEAHKTGDYNALYHLVVRRCMGVDPQNDVKLVSGLFGRRYDPFKRVESIEDLIRSTRRSTKEY